MSYAVNTSSQVLVIGVLLRMRAGGVFESPSALGPWKISDARPSQVDSIPPQSPVHNTKYVYVYESTPEVVYVGYTPAYMGCYPYYARSCTAPGVLPPYVSRTTTIPVP